MTLGRASTEAAIENLQVLESTCTEPHERALVLAARWRLDPTADAVRVAAAELYRHLYEQTPSVEYRDAYALLTGVTLPPGPPLPPLPERLEAESANIDELLRQVDEIIPQLAETGGASTDTDRGESRSGSPDRDPLSAPEHA